MRKLIAQFTRFGIVGAVGFVINLVVFNALRATVFHPEAVYEGPLLASIVATTIAIIFNWVGNRHWTFRAHRGRQLLREGIEFGIVSLGGMLIGLGCLWVSHYALGFTSVIADNIASNVIGLGLGTIFRFTLYRMWVFAPHRGEPEPALFPEVGADVPDQPSAEPSATPSRSSRLGLGPHPAATTPADALPQSD